MKHAEMYTLSGHKIHAPKGIGALVVKKGVRLAPRQIGGGQENNLRSGTENTPGIAGLRAAVGAMLARGDVAAALMEKKLRLVSAFQEAVPALQVNGPAPEDGAPHIVNLSFPGCARRDDAARAGGRRHLCVHRIGLFEQEAQGQPGAARHGAFAGPRPSARCASASARTPQIRRSTKLRAR